MQIVNAPKTTSLHYALIGDFHRVRLCTQNDTEQVSQIVLVELDVINDEVIIHTPNRNLPISLIDHVEVNQLFAFRIESLIIAKKFTKIIDTSLIKDAFVVSSSIEVLNYFYQTHPYLMTVLDLRDKAINSSDMMDLLIRSKAMLLFIGQAQINRIDFKLSRLQGLRFWLDSNSTSFNLEKKYINVIYGIYTHSIEQLYNTVIQDGLKHCSEGTLAIAHRGVPVLAPENSLSGFRHAINLHADIVEFDIHTSSDQHLIVMHDDNTKRTTSVSMEIKSSLMSQLTSLSLVSNHRSSIAENVPTFSQTIHSIRQSSIGAFIEIKDNNPVTSTLLNNTLRREDIEGRYQVISFIPDQLMQINQLDLCRVGWLNDIVKEDDDLNFALSKICEVVIPLRSSYNPYYGPLTRELVYQLHIRGIAVWPWTIDNEADMMRMIDIGVDGITSNNLPLLQSVMRGYKNAR